VGILADVLLLLACCLASSTLTAAAQRTSTARATSVFCAHGGVGLWPKDEVRPYYAVAVVDIDLPSATTSPLGVAEFTLSTDAGSPQASLMTIEGIVMLPVQPPSPLFATYLNPDGAPLPRPLPRGVTRVRIRMRLDQQPRERVTQFRLTLTGLGAPVTLSGRVNGEWPT
jgi:hypothetical protein